MTFLDKLLQFLQVVKIWYIHINETKHSFLLEVKKRKISVSKERFCRKPDKECLIGGIAFLLFIFFIISINSFSYPKTIIEKGIIPDNRLFLEAEFSSKTENQSFTVSSDGTFLASSSVVSQKRPQVLAASNNPQRERIISHRVEKGETLASVSEYFGISVETIKWANSITGNTLKEGQELLILPVTGVLYYVKTGDTLSHIATAHKAKSSEIIAFNNIKNETEIMPGDQLIIPNGQRPVTVTPQRAPATSFSNFRSVTRGTITQGVHPGHPNAVDIANSCGTPIYSGSGGTVVRTGYDRTAGNFVLINHGNFQALYAHLQVIQVRGGQQLSSGQQIGTMGTTGFSTGCHLHFETRGALNPFRGMQRGQVMR